MIFKSAELKFPELSMINTIEKSQKDKKAAADYEKAISVTGKIKICQ